MSVLNNLFTRSPFSPLQSHMERVAACVEKLEDLYDAYTHNDYERLNRIAEEISELEHMADLTKNDIRNHLPRGLFLAISRADLLGILALQDTIADNAEDIGVLMTLKKFEPIEGLEDDLKAFLDKNLEAVRHVHKIIRELDELLQASFGGKEAEKVRQMANEVAYLEHEADLMQRKFLVKLYNMDETLSYSNFTLWINILQAVADLGNKSENLANKISMLLDVR
ncbi:MAG: TIGR00153 family protein [Chlorobi bacterium]|nr:TIGR00153 family protein [Chlorobiota bacterium]